MKIKSIRKENVFVPTFNGNEDLPDEEQVTVNIKTFPTITEAQSYKSFRINDGGGVEILYPNDAVMLTRHVGSIKNIDLDDPDQKITNGSSLAKTKVLELADLVSEIRDYLLSASEAVEPGEN